MATEHDLEKRSDLDSNGLLDSLGDGDLDIKEKHRVTEPLTSTFSASSFRDLEAQHSHALEGALTNTSNDHHVTDLSLRSVEPVNVKVRNLSVNVYIKPSPLSKLFKKKAETKGVRILNDVSADMPSGQLTALIGASGSGKTSMLNVLSQRMRGANLAVSGNISFNNSSNLHTVQYAYVMQQDVLIPTLTVRETLTYSADLRLSSSTTANERKKVVEEVILELGLKECANTRIGDSDHKGCSGGEKRRVSIGVQLLANPSVLFLDEPTTGLDATSAHQLVRTLKNLAQKGRTIITTIHQPRSEIWELFDRVILLGRGQPLYSGTQSNALTYFASLDHHLPLHVNPADFLIDTSAIDSKTPEAEEASVLRVNALVSSWRAVSASTFGASTASPAHSLAGSKEASDRKVTKALRAPMWRQIDVMTRRTIITTIRDPFGFSGSLIEAAAMAVVTGLVFLMLDRSLQGIRSREGAIYTACALQGYLVLLYETWRLSNVDIHVFDRERGEGIVGVAAFLISRRLGRLFLEDIPVPLIYSAICYFMNNLDREFSSFMVYFVVVLIGQFIAVGFASVCVAISRNFAEASLVANLNFTLQSTACGYFIQSNTLPVYVRWTKYISYVYYSFGILINNEFKDNFYDCPSGNAQDPSCLEYDGNFIMASLGVPYTWMLVPFMAILGYAVFFQFAAGIMLKYLTVDIHLSKQRPMSADSSAGKEKMVEQSAEVVMLDVVLQDYRLGLLKYNLLGKRQLDFEILKGISTKFEAGSLNIVMGPSGSGKSSLLNLMAQRLHSSLLSRYTFSGSMLFNGSLPSDSVIRSLCSYVTQDDDALLASLTVRETLRFAAGLRLPKHMSRAEKNRRAEEVILKMGLKDCADTVIGSEYVKGISGGEKRRVTIAVQVLTEPRILLLDEPTSGLDAFTAASILTVLRGLAEEGRTLICTIHQSRSDLFTQFGNVLLLARGGSVVYSGTANNMLPYFASQGYNCPSNTNPADFALDLVTVDLQHEQREAKSRAKVQGLIDVHAESVKGLAVEHRTITMPAELGRLKREQAPFHVAYPILTHRSFINLFRQPQLVTARLMQVIGLGLVVALFFAPLKHDYFSIQNRLGFVQQILPLYFVGLLQNAALYPFERDVFYREHDDGAYGVEAFILSYITNEIPFEIVSSLVFAVLADIACGLPRTPKIFFIVAFNAFCITSCGESLGIMFNTLFSHTGFAINVTSTILSVSMFMAGIMSLNIPGFLKAFNYLSPVKYAVQNLLPYTLKGVMFTCTAAQEVNGVCPIQTGEDVLRIYNYNFNAGMNLLWLAVATLSYRLVAWGIVRVTRMKLGVGKMGRKKKTKQVEGETSVVVPTPELSNSGADIERAKVEEVIS